jgi:DHA1 family inner membrane transport protein
VGVVIGAPTLTALGVRFPPRRTLVALMVVFVVGNTLSALAPTYETLVAARVLTALVHGAFFGVGAVAARRLVPPERATQAIALMITGLTLANVVGVPLGTLVAQQLSWRLVLGGIAVIGLVTIATLLAWLPAGAGERGDLRAELSAFRRPQVWLVLALTMFGFAALFAVYSYVSPILTDLAGLPEGWVTPVLALFGVGMTVGTLAGGRLGDRFGFSLVVVGLLLTALLLAGLALTARTPAAAVVCSCCSARWRSPWARSCRTASSRPPGWPAAAWCRRPTRPPSTWPTRSGRPWVPSSSPWTSATPGRSGPGS